MPNPFVQAARCQSLSRPQPQRPSSRTAFVQHSTYVGPVSGPAVWQVCNNGLADSPAMLLASMAIHRDKCGKTNSTYRKAPLPARHVSSRGQLPCEEGGLGVSLLEPTHAGEPTQPHMMLWTSHSNFPSQQPPFDLANAVLVGWLRGSPPKSPRQTY